MKLKGVVATVATVGIVVAGGTIETDNMINPYTSSGTTLQMESKSMLPDGGMDATSIDTTQPKVTFSRWNKEVNMGVRLLGMQAKGGRKFLSKEVDWQQGNETMTVTPLASSSVMQDGGYEINVVLAAKPASNVFNFSIDGAQNLDFFYQPLLTAKEIADGAIRPDNVVGSYAVYYKDHANHIEGQTNYATGKAFHIFRPLVSDSFGHETWATLLYSGGVLSVTVPQSFLNAATYPVTIDPSIGYTTGGLSSHGWSVNFVLRSGKQYTPSSAGILSSGSIFAACNCGVGSPNNEQIAIYSGTTYIDNTSAISVPAPDLVGVWYSANVVHGAGVYPTNSNYYLILNQQSGGGAIRVFYDTTGNEFSKWQAQTYGTWPATLNPANNEISNEQISMYFTFNATSTQAMVDNQVLFFQ